MGPDVANNSLVMKPFISLLPLFLIEKSLSLILYYSKKRNPPIRDATEITITRAMGSGPGFDAKAYII